MVKLGIMCHRGSGDTSTKIPLHLSFIGIIIISEMTITGKMKKSLVKKLIAPVVLAVGLLFSPVKANAQLPIMDPFSQPNDSNLVWYGSGDVDSNNVRDGNDYNLISQGAQSNQADIDGDGILGTPEDADLFAKYLNGDTLLPQINWAWPMMTRESRKEWALKTSVLDSTKIKHPDWFCGRRATNTIIALHGYSELKDSTVSRHFEKYDLKNNGKFNINAKFVSISSESGFPDGSHAHFVYAILVGNNPLNFYDWIFIDPSYPNKIMSIGDINLPNDSEIDINYTRFKDNGTISEIPYITFKANEGVPGLKSYLEDYLILERPYVNSIKPEKLNLLEKFVLNQNYPNPFNSQTEIKYSIPKAGNVLLNVYNLEGKSIRTLFNNHQQAGDYRVTFIAKDLPSGQYFYRLRTGDAVETKKMMLVK